MKKKLLYGVVCVFGLFILLALIDPAPDSIPVQVQNTEQKNQSESVIQSKVVATATPAHAVVEIKVPAQEKSQPAQNTYYAVTGVVDGDTIKINMNGTTETLRLIGMDTPETVDPRKPVQCFGKEASNKAKELLSGKNVRIETDSSQGTRDKYDRLLAYVYREDGLFYNKHMIEQGYAHEYTYNAPYKYQTEFKAAQREAQTKQAGLWSLSTCNGNTTSSNTSANQTIPTVDQTGGKFYTSSHYSSKYYYPETCDGWKSLSASYLKSYISLEALLVAYPSKIKSPQCN